MACGPSTRDGDATEPARATEAAGRRPMIKATVARIGRTLYVFMFSSLGSVLLREAWLDILTISQEGKSFTSFSMPRRLIAHIVARAARQRLEADGDPICPSC